MSQISELVTRSIRPYRAEDARLIRFTPEALASYQNAGDLERQWKEYERMGPAWTLRVGDDVVCCAGLMRLWRGRAHAWLLPSVTMPSYSKTIVLALVDHLRALIHEQQFVRIECHVMKEHQMGRRLVEWLGFKQEAIMERYGPNDEDYVQYALIQPRDAA
jgi:hypothetical protein